MSGQADFEPALRLFALLCVLVDAQTKSRVKKGAGDTAIPQEKLISFMEQEVEIRHMKNMATLLVRNLPDTVRLEGTLGFLFQSRFEQFRHKADIDAAVSHFRRALLLSREGGLEEELEEALIDLSTTLRERYDTTRSDVDLSDSIFWYRELATNMFVPGDARMGKLLGNLAILLSDRYDRVGQIKDLEDAISVHRKILSLQTITDAVYRVSICSLAGDLVALYRRQGGLQTLEEAISSYRRSLPFFDTTDQNLASARGNLGVALNERFNVLGNLEDLEEAVETLRSACLFYNEGDVRRAIPGNSLGVALLTRFQKLGRQSDLDEALQIQEEVHLLRPADHPNRSASANNLAATLRMRYNLIGQVADLEKAIVCLREAILLRPGLHPHRSDSLNNMGNALIDRFNILWRAADLNEAIEVLKESLSLRPPGHPLRSSSFSNLGNAYRERYLALRDPEDLGFAITYHREAVQLSTPGHHQHSLQLNNLASSLLESPGGEGGKGTDIEECIALFRDSLSFRPPGHPGRFRTLWNLGQAGLKSGFQGDKLNEVVSWLKEALALTTGGHAQRSTMLFGLARALKQQGDESEALLLWLQGLDYPYSPTRVKFLHSIVGLTMFDSLEAKLSMASRSLALLDRFIILLPGLEGLQKNLAEDGIASLGVDAAAVAFGLHRYEKGIELLERGSRILLTRLEGYRASVENIRLVEPDLARRLESTGRDLEKLAIKQSSDVGEQNANAEAQITQQRLLIEKWDNTLSKIRTLPGFSNFLTDVPYSRLRIAAREGPVIVVNSSQYRTDAIIIQSSGPPIPMPLSTELFQEGTKRVKDLYNRLRGHQSPSRQLLLLLRWLWTEVVQPVVLKLGDLNISLGSRIWWCPTGSFRLLPIHAAGEYCRGGRNLPDIFISSYTPTLDSLVSAREVWGTGIGQRTQPLLTLIGHTGGNLMKISEELQRISSIEGLSTRVLYEKEATSKAALDALHQSPWAHFSCHGYVDEQPFRSSFLLQDSRLEMSDILSSRPPNAEFAFLSACHSAAPGLASPNESIHLASALQFCGFRSVVGTLWEITDNDAPTVANDFYRFIFESGASCENAAAALQHAVRELRRSRVPPERWVPFVHIGC